MEVSACTVTSTCCDSSREHPSLTAIHCTDLGESGPLRLPTHWVTDAKQDRAETDDELGEVVHEQGGIGDRTLHWARRRLGGGRLKG